MASAAASRDLPSGYFPSAIETAGVVAGEEGAVPAIITKDCWVGPLGSSGDRLHLDARTDRRLCTYRAMESVRDRLPLIRRGLARSQDHFLL
jgi:hypothetical protein